MPAEFAYAPSRRCTRSWFCLSAVFDRARSDSIARRPRASMLIWVIEAAQSMTDTITIRRPDDWHVHLRDGAMLAAVLPYTARQFARAIVMPNLVPPVTTVAGALAYRERISPALPAGARLHAADDLLPDRRRATRTRSRAAIARASSPRSSSTRRMPRPIRRTASPISTGCMPVLERMAEIGMPLLVHGEVTDPDGRHLRPRGGVHRQGARPAAPPAARIAHRARAHHDRGGGAIMSSAAAPISRRRSPRITSSSTATRIFQGGIRPHLYCLPIAKREKHRLALRRAATSGDPHFFLGTDSAPHADPDQGNRLRLRRHLHRAGGARALCRGLRRGRRARPARGLRLAQRPALLRPAGQRSARDPAPRAARRAGPSATANRGRPVPRRRDPALASCWIVSLGNGDCGGGTGAGRPAKMSDLIWIKLPDERQPPRR